MRNDQTEVPHSVVADDERKQLHDRIAALTRVIGRLDDKLMTIQNLCGHRLDATTVAIGSLADISRILCAEAINA